MNELRDERPGIAELAPTDLGVRIEEAMLGILPGPILEICAEERSVLTKKGGEPQVKADGEFVTGADLRIQEYLLNYFRTSPIAGLYRVTSEESISELESGKSKDAAVLQLLIDPLDGTNAFLRGEPAWGVMVGIADQEGVLHASWNMVSSGACYTSFDPTSDEMWSWERALEDSGKLAIDIYDYHGTAAERFPAILEEVSGGWIGASQLHIDSSPAAVIAGWEMVQHRLDGLLWVPGTSGKRTYPDYDLLFLGALQARGWRISRGKREQLIVSVAVAPTDAELDLLEQAGRVLGVNVEGLSYTRAAAITAPLWRE